MATLTRDDIWKVVQLALTMLVVPLAGWVWNMNVQVADLKNDLGDAEAVIADLRAKTSEAVDNAKQIIGIERDIEYMKQSLSRIETMITRRGQ